MAGSIPDGISSSEAVALQSFVQKFAKALFREGGNIIHGSHPTLTPALIAAARELSSSSEARDALTLVRSQRFSNDPEQLAEIDWQRAFASVQIVPDSTKPGEQPLVSMREWMADRCDVVVAVGGRWYDISKQSAGVPLELEECLQRGKAAFVVGGFGGAILSYIHDEPALLSRLRNGLSAEDNQRLAGSKDEYEVINTIVSQLKLLPLVRESISRGRSFRILALDGGGIRGAFTAAVLSKWDKMLGDGSDDRLVRHFDLVAGTSTGAILAIGLGLGFPPAEILKFYKTEGSKIFPKNRGLRHWLKSKHDSRTLRETLNTIFGNKRLSEASCCRLVIPTVRARHGESEAIVTAHCPDRTAFRDILAVDAALASAAAPTYFDEAEISDDIAVQSYLDGGLWANNPVLPAIAEAVRHLNVPLDRIEVLSVGTLSSEKDFTKSLSAGKAGWAPTSADLFFSAQEHGAASMADSLLGRTRLLRVNQLTPYEIKLDDTEAIADLTERGSNVGKDTFAGVRSRFLDGYRSPDWRKDSVVARN